MRSTDMDRTFEPGSKLIPAEMERYGPRLLLLSRTSSSFAFSIARRAPAMTSGQSGQFIGRPAKKATR